VAIGVLKTKTDKFFELLALNYGQDVVDRAWPSELQKTGAKKIYEKQIEQYTVEQLSGAFAFANKMKASSDQWERSEWSKINIPLLLSAVRIQKPAYSTYIELPQPIMTKEEKQKKLAEIRALLK
jgi:hypothetical protein